MNITIKILLLPILFIIIHCNVNSQIKGVPPETSSDVKEDTVFIFKSPRPLIEPSAQDVSNLNAWGIDVIFSDNGVGAGAFWSKYFTRDFLAFISLYVSGARNTDEFEYYNNQTGGYEVSNKINRLYMFPLTVGVLQFLFSDVLTETLKPYISAGIGPTFIVSTPYRDSEGYVIEFFKSFGYAKSYIKFGAFGGIGSYIGNFGSSIMALNLRYYFIPFGGNGLESVQGSPIKDFGGVFLSLSIGMKY